MSNSPESNFVEIDQSGENFEILLEEDSICDWQVVLGRLVSKDKQGNCNFCFLSLKTQTSLLSAILKRQTEIPRSIVSHFCCALSSCCVGRESWSGHLLDELYSVAVAGTSETSRSTGCCQLVECVENEQMAEKVCQLLCGKEVDNMPLQAKSDEEGVEEMEVSEHTETENQESAEPGDVIFQKNPDSGNFMDLPAPTRQIAETLAESLAADNVEGSRLPPKSAQIFSLLTPRELSAVCDMLKMDEMSESAACVMCECFLNVTPDVSHASALVFAQRCLLVQMKVASGMSRCLTSTLIQFAVRYPNVLFSGVVFPVLQGETLSISQAEHIKLILKDDQVLGGPRWCWIMLVELCGIAWGEQLLGVLQVMVERCHDDQTASDIAAVSDAIHKMATPMSDSRPFVKLVICFVNKFGKLLAQTDLKKISEAVQKNRTFLKKAAENAVKKFQM